VLIMGKGGESSAGQMLGTTSTALSSFSHDQHHETDVAKFHLSIIHSIIVLYCLAFLAL